MLFIVSRDRRELHDYLTKEFRRDEHVQVVLDRRLAERRLRRAAPSREQRRASRRMVSPVDKEIRSSGFAVVRPQHVGSPN